MALEPRDTAESGEGRAARSVKLDGADLLAAAVGAVLGFAIHQLIKPFPEPGLGGLLDGTAVYAWVLSLLALCGFGAFSVLLSLIDIRSFTLPNGLVLWANLWVILLLNTSSLFARDWNGLLLAWIGAVVSGLLAFFGWLRWGSYLGAGDVKLMPVAAFAAVWGSSGHEYLTGLIVFPALLLGGLLVFGIAGLILQRERIPAGPIILGASWLTIVVLCEPLGEWINR